MFCNNIHPNCKRKASGGGEKARNICEGEGDCTSIIKSMKTSTVDNQNQFPDEIVLDVLSRLSAESLARFRCVCKLWSSIIRDSHFVNLHQTRSNSRSDGTGLLLLSADCFFLVNHHGNASPKNLPIINITGQRLATPEVVNGLVCVVDWVYHQASIFNLSTRDVITLPQTTTRFNFLPMYLLGCDASAKIYKMVIVCRNYESKNLRKHCLVFTLGTKSWRKIDAGPLKGFPTSVPCLERVCVNGAIYWIQDDLVGKREIFEFDVSAEKFRIIPPPQNAVLDDKFSLIQVGGRLALVHVSKDVHLWGIKLWILEDSHNQVWVQDNMTIELSVARVNNLRLIGTISSGEILLVQHPLSAPLWLVYYDPTTRKSRELQVFPGSELKACTAHVENILPLPK